MTLQLSILCGRNLRMKNKWKITYWDSSVDKHRVTHTDTFEDAMTKSFKLRMKGHSNVQVKLNKGKNDN